MKDTYSASKLAIINHCLYIAPYVCNYFYLCLPFPYFVSLQIVAQVDSALVLIKLNENKTKVEEVHCRCKYKDLLWCGHVVAGISFINNLSSYNIHI